MKHPFTLLFGIAMIVVISIAVSGTTPFSLFNFAQTKPSQQQGEIKEFINENGFVELKPTNDKKVLKVGAQETIDVIVSIPEKQVTAFNIPIKYDAAKLEFVGIEVLDARYNMHIRREGTNSIVLVAAQQPTNIDKIFLYKATVARFIVKVKTAGAAQLEVTQSSPKGYLLKLVNETNDALLPSYGKLNVTAN